MTSRRLAQVGVGTALGVAAALVIGLAARRAEPLPVLWEAPRFALETQAGDTLRSEELRGTAWVASFIFTNCTDFCPLVTRRVAEVRDRLAEQERLGTEVRLVSFTVDPARDTPAVLAEYAAGYGASPPSAWAFLTGSDPEAIRRMIQEGFHLTAMHPLGPEHDYQVPHTPRLAIVDADGLVRATYDANEPDVVAQVLEALERL